MIGIRVLRLEDVAALGTSFRHSPFAISHPPFANQELPQIFIFCV